MALRVGNLTEQQLKNLNRNEKRRLKRLEEDYAQNEQLGVAKNVFNPRLALDKNKEHYSDHMKHSREKRKIKEERNTYRETFRQKKIDELSKQYQDFNRQMQQSGGDMNELTMLSKHNNATMLSMSTEKDRRRYLSTLTPKELGSIMTPQNTYVNASSSDANEVSGILEDRYFKDLKFINPEQNAPKMEYIKQFLKAHPLEARRMFKFMLSEQFVGDMYMRSDLDNDFQHKVDVMEERLDRVYGYAKSVMDSASTVEIDFDASRYKKERRYRREIDRQRKKEETRASKNTLKNLPWNIRT